MKETYQYKTGTIAPDATRMTSPMKGDVLRFDEFWGTLDIGRPSEKPAFVFHLSMWQQPTRENNLVAGRVFVGPRSTAVTVLRIDTLAAGVPFFLYHLDDIATGNCKTLR